MVGTDMDKSFTVELSANAHINDDLFSKLTSDQYLNGVIIVTETREL